MQTDPWDSTIPVSISNRSIGCRLQAPSIGPGSSGRRSTYQKHSAVSAFLDFLHVHSALDFHWLTSARHCSVADFGAWEREASTQPMRASPFSAIEALLLPVGVVQLFMLSFNIEIPSA
jgi:hypothetical protein